LKILKARFYFLASVILYISVFLIGYEEWVAPKYTTWGMGYRDIPIGYILSSWLMCLIPAIWMPYDLTRPSQILFYIQYFVIFIPTTFILYHSVRPELAPELVLMINSSLFLGLMILQVGYKIQLFRIKKIYLSDRFLWRAFWIFSLFLPIYLMTVFGGHFQLADFEEIYKVRSSSTDIVEKSNSWFAGYAQMWLSGFVLPFIFATGVFKRRWGYVFLVLVGYLYLFGVGGSKATILAVVYLPAIYFLIRDGGKNAAIKIAICLAGVLAAPIMIIFLEGGEGVMELWYLAVVHARTFSIPQLSIGQYYNFFSINPLTYGSHVTGIREFIDYPYDMDVPRVIGYYFYNADLGANVNFWGQDGIASFGLIGIPIVSLVVSVLFWVFDSIASVHDTRFVTLCLGNIALTFANISLFTTLFSGGLILLIVALYFFRKESIF
jgi:hypothetical protein